MSIDTDIAAPGTRIHSATRDGYAHNRFAYEPDAVRERRFRELFSRFLDEPASPLPDIDSNYERSERDFLRNFGSERYGLPVDLNAVDDVFEFQAGRWARAHGVVEERQRRIDIGTDVHELIESMFALTQSQRGAFYAAQTSEVRAVLDQFNGDSSAAEHAAVTPA